jgi:phosphoglycolate phosphatase
MKKDYRHILWDWNGTLVNDMDLCVFVTNTLIKRRNNTLISKETYQREFTFPVIDFYKVIGFDFSKENYGDMAEEWILEYKRHFEAQSTLNGDVKQTLQKLHHEGYLQSIFSACENELLKHSIRHLELTDYFHKIHGTDNNHAHGKTELALQIIRDKHVNPEETVLFGDTVHDYEVAQNAGIDCVLIANGHQDETRLKKTGAPVICDISTVPAFLRSLQ